MLIPANAKGKLDVAEAIGVGLMSVIMDTGMKEPYVGQVALLSGEIAEDLTYYYATSEQTPSSVGLGVLLNKDNTIKASGGFIIQLMPGCPDEIIDKLEEKKIKSSKGKEQWSKRAIESTLTEEKYTADVAIADSGGSENLCNITKG